MPYDALALSYWGDRNDLRLEGLGHLGRCDGILLAPLLEGLQLGLVDGHGECGDDQVIRVTDNRNGIRNDVPALHQVQKRTHQRLERPYPARAYRGRSRFLQLRSLTRG